METNATIIITLEDVLFETSQSELNFIRENYFPYFCTTIIQIPTWLKTSERPYKYDIVETLARDNDPGRIELANAALESAYFKKEKVFNNFLQETKLSEKIRTGTNFLTSSVIKNIVILYNSKNEEQERIYQNILKDYYKDSKFVFINMYNKDILTYLKTTSWNLLITDLKDLVVSCAECKELNLERKEFLMPDYNYTKLEEKTKVLIDERGGVLNYYKN